VAAGAQAQGRDAKLVVVDPIRTRTAEAADWHLQIKPASDAALALAMMHVMVRDGLVDLDFVTRHAIGYDALAARVQQYSPAQVAPMVGLPADVIRRCANCDHAAFPAAAADRDRAPPQRRHAVP
jgi:anaerobic selenocysteine-containing dehydrogenase